MSRVTTLNKKQKSVKLSELELQELASLRTTSNSDTQLSEIFGIDRVSLIRIITIGSGSDTNVKKIRRRLLKLTPVIL